MARIPSYQEHRSGYNAIFGGFLIHIMIGTFYLWGNINIYVTSYLRYKNNDVTTDILNSNFPFMGMTMSVLTPFSLDIGKKFGLQRTCFICTLFFSLCAFLASFQTDYRWFTLIYGLASGIASGIIYMIPYYIAYCHFPDHKGMASGVISAGFGVSTFLFSWIVFFLANPSNVAPIFNSSTQEMYFPDEVSQRVPRLFRILSFIFLVIGCIGSYLCAPLQEDKVNQLARQHDATDEERYHSSATVKNECRDIKSGLSTPFIYFSIILMALYGSQGNLVMDNYKPIGSQLGHFSDAYLTIVGSVGSLFNGFLRIIWGRALDHYGFKNLAILNLVIELFLMLTMSLASQSEYTFIVWILGIFSCFGGWSAKMPPLLANIYGNTIGSIFYGIAVQGQVVACWLQFFVVQNYRISLGWFFIFMIYSAIIVLGIFMTQFVDFHIDWNEFYKKRHIEDDEQDNPAKNPNYIEMKDNYQNLDQMVI